MDQPPMFYPVQASQQSANASLDMAMAGTGVQDNATTFDPLARTLDPNNRVSTISLDSLDSAESNEAAETSFNGLEDRPLPSNNAPLHHTSTLTEFTKRRNWANRIVDELEDLFQVLTSQGRFVYISPSSAKVIGYAPEELVGKYIVDYVHEDDSTLFQREFNESIASGQQLRLFYRLRRKDDTYAILEGHGHPHLASASHVGLRAINNCPGYFIMSRLYPTKNASLLDSFLEHKTENERLVRRINELKQEEAADEEEAQRRSVAFSDEMDTTGSSVSTPLRAGAGEADGSPSTSRKDALTKQNLTDATARDEPDSIKDKMARYEGGTHIDTIELLTGLDYRAGERSHGVSTGAASPVLVPGDGISGSGAAGLLSADKKKKIKILDDHVCTDCGTLDSPEWRKGPTGPKSLCNACGLRWAKKEKRAKTGP